MSPFFFLFKGALVSKPLASVTSSLTCTWITQEQRAEMKWAKESEMNEQEAKREIV